MPGKAWVEALEALARAHALWEAAKAVALRQELGRWGAADGLFSALLARANQARDAGEPVPATFLRRVVELHARLAAMLRLAADQRASALDGVYEGLYAALTGFESDRPSGGDGSAQAVPASPRPTATLVEDDLLLYDTDARGQARLVWAYSLIAVVLVAVLVGSIVRFSIDGTPTTGSLALPLSGLGILVLLALAAGQQARECRRALFETRRVHRQLLTLDKYLSPLPELGQDLLRGVMMQRLFPRLIDDDNPMREDEVFPQVDPLMMALSPELRDLRRRHMKGQAERGSPRPGAQGSAQEADSPTPPPAPPGLSSG